MSNQTHEEKVKMYKKLSKKELIELLISSNNALELKLAPVINPSPVYVIPECDHAWYTDYSITACQTRCTKCGKIWMQPDTLTYPPYITYVQPNTTVFIQPSTYISPTTTTNTDSKASFSCVN